MQPIINLTGRAVTIGRRILLPKCPRDLFPQLVRHPLGRSFLSFGYSWVTDGSSNLEEFTVQLPGIMIRRPVSGSVLPKGFTETREA